MGGKDSFEHRARRPFGPMEPAEGEPGRFTSVHEAIFEGHSPAISEARPRTIEFRRKTASWFSFPYHCVMNLEYVPHSMIVVTFSTHKVTVSGRDLKRIYRAIRTQRCEGVEEADRAAAFVEESASVVEEISILELRGRKGSGGASEFMPGVE